jgi:CHAT domain-containing protein
MGTACPPRLRRIVLHPRLTFAPGATMTTPFFNPLFLRRTLLALGLCAAAMAVHAQATPAARPNGRMSLAADTDAFSRDVQSIVAMSSNGNTLYDADSRKGSWQNYCGTSRSASERGEFRAAVRDASKALFLGGGGADPLASAFATRDLAIAYSWAGDLDNAQLWADRALAYAKKITSGSTDVDYQIRFDAIKTLGDVAFRRNQYAQALVHYKEAETKLPWIGAGFYKDFSKLSIANVQSKMNLPEAQAALLGLTKSGDAGVRMLALRSLTVNQLASQQIDQALLSAQSLNALSKESKNTYNSLWAQYLLAQVHQQAGQKDAAIKAALAAVSLADRVRAGFYSAEVKTSLFSNVQEVFELAAQLLADAERWEEAFQVSERSRARATLDLMRNVQTASPSTDGNRSKAQSVLTAADIQARLPENTALVSYYVLPTTVLIWQIDASGVKGFKVNLNKDQLAKDVASFREAIEQENTTKTNQLATSLYAQLATPLKLSTEQALIITPHSFLHFLPFQALKSANGWWIEQRPISYALSGSTLPEQTKGNEMTPALQNVLALGNPDVNDNKLDLPGASLEVEGIKALYPTTQIFTRKEASKIKVMSDGANASILHIAAHAMVDEIDPIHSYVLLSNPAAISGRAGGELEARDLGNMKLSKTSLVTLSACNSGIGKIAKGDEFSGFKTAILLAGASRLLVSLWPVDDDATAALMGSFYKSAATMKPAAAMRKAQLELIATNDTNSPFKWAPFVLVGDPR